MYLVILQDIPMCIAQKFERMHGCFIRYVTQVATVHLNGYIAMQENFYIWKYKKYATAIILSESFNSLVLQC